MAKELIVKAWCDPCGDEGKRIEGSAYQLGVDGKWLEVDLCEQHGQLAEALQTLWRVHGQPMDGPATATRTTGVVKRGPGPKVPEDQRKRAYKPRVPATEKPESELLHCLLCPRFFTHASGLQGHFRREHNIDATLGEIYGNRCPECGDTMNTFRDLSYHMRTAHGVLHVSSVMASSKDRHGVIAERRKMAEDMASTLV